MSSVPLALSAGQRLKLFSISPEERRGLILSHLLGLSLFSEFVFNFIKAEIPLTPVLQIPIRLICIWLLFDRGGRISRLRFGTWDALILGFVVTTGIGLVITANFYTDVPVSFEDYRRFAGVFLNGYLYYLAMKEGLNRKGFRPDIAINWLLAGFTFSALLGIAQAINVPHVRDFVLHRYRILSETDILSQTASSQATGTAIHWNSMAFEMLVAFALVFGPSFRRKPHWWEIALGFLFMGAFIATQSRGGLLAFGACAVGTVAFYWLNGKPRKAMLIAAVIAVSVVIWGVTVFALKVERFTRTIEGEKVRSSIYLRSIDVRVERQKECVRIGMKHPLFGTGPNSLLFPGDNVRVMYHSTSSILGTVDGQYGLAFAQFGLVGSALILAMFLTMVGFFRRRVAYRPYAFAVFFIGLGIIAHGVVEYLVYSRGWIVIHPLMALATCPYLVSESGRALARRAVPAVFARERQLPAEL